MSTPGQIERHLKTEALYKRIIGMYPGSVMDAVGETHIRGILDAILSQGKIEGRLTALAERQRIPAVNEVWVPVDDPQDSVEVKFTVDVPVVHYRSTGTGRSPAQTHLSCRVSYFLNWHTPATEPVPDHLIEAWQRIVDSNKKP